MSESSHELKGSGAAITAEPQELLESIEAGLGGLRLINDRSDMFNTVEQYWDPDSNKVIVVVSPNAPGAFGEFQIIVPPEKAMDAFKSPHGYRAKIVGRMAMRPAFGTN